MAKCKACIKCPGRCLGTTGLDHIEFPRPTGHKLTYSRFLVEILVDSSKWTGNFPRVLGFEPVNSQNSTGSSVTIVQFSTFIAYHAILFILLIISGNAHICQVFLQF